MSKPAIAAPRPDAVVAAGEGAFTLKLARGEVVTFTEAGAAPRPIAPVPPEAKLLNSFGLP
jgi:hypothetical protein